VFYLRKNDKDNLFYLCVCVCVCVCTVSGKGESMCVSLQVINFVFVCGFVCLFVCLATDVRAVAVFQRFSVTAILFFIIFVLCLGK